MKPKLLQASLLTLVGLFAISNPSGAQDWKLTGNAGTNSNTNFIGTTDNINFKIRTKNNVRVIITAGGKVAIGNVNPVFKLDVMGGSTNTDSMYRISGVPVISRNSINAIQIGDASAKIGIGLATPSSALHVLSSDYVSLTQPGFLTLGDVAGYNTSMDVDVIQARYNGTAAPLYLNYYGGDTYLGLYGSVAIGSGGNLTTSYPTGINGNYNASYALNVNATTSYNGINVTDGGNAYSLYAIKSGLLAGMKVDKTSATSSDACVWGNSTGQATGVQGNSNSGVGVYGITNNSGNYAGFFAGSVYTTGTYQPSDLKLKKNVKDFSKAMDIVNQLQPKTYQYKDDGDYTLMHLPAGDRYGFIAEDLEKVLPNLVKQTRFETATDKDRMNGTASVPVDFKAINYTELIPILVKGMQEQEAVIAKQQQQIDDMQQTVKRMENISKVQDVKPGNIKSDAYLMQNVPNPFIQSTMVRCYVQDAVTQSQLEVYDENGVRVKSFPLFKGMNEVEISAGNLPAGQYTYVLVADGKKTGSGTMTIIK